jgi:hypothetical protein
MIHLTPVSGAQEKQADPAIAWGYLGVLLH